MGGHGAKKRARWMLHLSRIMCTACLQAFCQLRETEQKTGTWAEHRVCRLFVPAEKLGLSQVQSTVF